MVQVLYYSWNCLHGHAQLTEQDVAAMPSLHDAPKNLWDHYDLLRKDDSGISALPESQIFIEELVKTLDSRTLTRAAYNALSYSQNLVDDHLIAYLRVLDIQMRLIGLRWYATPPFLEALASAAARQTTHFDDSRPGPGVRSQRKMQVYGAAYKHIT